MNAVIRIRLSETGRKANILAGGDGKEIQDIQIPREDPIFAAVVADGKITGDNVLLDQSSEWLGSRYGDWDAMPTATEVLDHMAAIKAAKKAKAAAESAGRVAQVAATLSERRTHSMTLGSGPNAPSYRYVQWPTVYGDEEIAAKQAIVTSPEAVAWEAELAAEKAAAEARRDELDAAAKAAQEAADAAKAEARAKRRAEMGLEDGQIALGIEDGALTQVPGGCWESHRRGKNWFATITPCPSSPGGLARDFATKAHGDSYYMLPSLSAGDAVEFGADYYTGGGRKNASRWYGYVVRVEPTYLVLCECSTGKAAYKAGLKFVGARKPDTSVAEAIERVNGEGAIVS